MPARHKCITCGVILSGENYNKNLKANESIRIHVNYIRVHLDLIRIHLDQIIIRLD